MESNFIYNQIWDRYKAASDDSFFANAFNHNQINADFLAKLVDVFREPSSFRIEMFQDFDLNEIKHYIAYTHHYYITKKLPEIEQSIYFLVEQLRDKNPNINLLINLYLAYYNQLVSHIAFEDKQLLPYISYLQNALENGFNSKVLFSQKFNYSLANFATNHNETSELNLESIQHFIIKHLPQQTNSFAAKILLLQLETFKTDLIVHELVEDYILIPRSRILEKKLEKKILKLALLN